MKESESVLEGGYRGKTLGIFTVKHFRLHKGVHWTFGGFGDYLNTILPYFHRVVLVCHVLSAPPREGDYAVDDPRITFAALPATRNELDVLLSIPEMLRRGRRALEGVDLVHARMPDYTGIVGAYLARKSGIPCFHQIVDDWREQGEKISPYRKRGLGLFLKAHLYLYDYFERRISAGQLVFAQGKSCYEKHAPFSDCHLVVSSSHHDEDIVPHKPRFLSPPFQILNVARMNSVKNQQLLIRALVFLRDGNEDWRLTLAGDGPQRASLEALTKQLGLEDVVRFTGMVRHGTILWKFFDEADVFVLTSRSEGTPKVILEAMARDLPVVAPRVSGIPTLIEDGECGLLFEDNDLKGLLGCIQRIREERILRERIAAKASAFAREHTIERETVRIIDAVFSKWPHLSGTIDRGKE